MWSYTFVCSFSFVKQRRLLFARTIHLQKGSRREDLYHLLDKVGTPSGGDNLGKGYKCRYNTPSYFCLYFQVMQSYFCMRISILLLILIFNHSGLIVFSLLLLILIFSHFGLIVFVSVYFSVILLDSDFAFSIFLLVEHIFSTSSTCQYRQSLSCVIQVYLIFQFDFCIIMLIWIKFLVTLEFIYTSSC